MAYYIHDKSIAVEQAIETCACSAYETAQSAHEIRKSCDPIMLANDVPLARVDAIVSFWIDEYERAAWQRRERGRFNDETYVRVPWSAIDEHDLHFAHLSIKSPGLVAYTENEEKGHADRQTTIKPGRYLAQFYPDMKKIDVDRYVAACVTDLPTLEITTDEDQIEKVYTHGPRSCMSRPRRAYNGHCHPSAIYADSPDLALAFLRDTSDPDSYVARCVVWPDKKTAVRVYPDGHPTMRRLLEIAGYDISSRDDCNGKLNGARVRAIEDDNGHGFIMGYVDGISYAKHEGEYLVLGRGSLDCSQTKDWNGDTIAAGTTEPHEDESESEDDDNRFTCDHCNRTYDEDEYAGDGICQSCEDDRRTCGSCDSRFYGHDNEYQTTRSGDVLCEDCAANDTIECEIDGCGNTWIDAVEFSTREQRERDSRNVAAICRSCADEYDRCSECDEYTPIGSLTCEECESSNVAHGRDEQTIDLPLGDEDDTPIMFRLEVCDRSTGDNWTVCIFPNGDTCTGSDFGVLVNRGRHLLEGHPRSAYRVISNRGNVTPIDAIETENTERESEAESCAAF